MSSVVKTKRRESAGCGTTISYQYPSGGVEEILRPTLVVSGGRSYRKLTDVEFGRRAGSGERRGREAKRLEPSDGFVEEEEEEEETVYRDDVYDEGEDLETEVDGVERLSNGNYRLKLTVPSVFFKYIIGREGRIKKGIERDTECHLWLPSRGIEGDVVIEGPAKPNVADAKRRVEIIVWTNREKEKATHFISIPLTVTHIRDRVLLFKSSVLDSCRRERGISEDVFQLPEKFHLTIGVLRIFSEEEEEKAKAVVKEAIAMAKAVLGSDPAVMCVGGVDTMKDDPTAVDVLFAKVVLTENPDRLQAFVDAVQSHVIAGAPDLMRREFDREGVKLHATLMNSCFPVTLGKTAEGRGNVGGNWRKTEKERREPFDARKILREFRDFEFGQMSLQILHLSKRKEYGPDGFYRCVQNYALSQIEPNACS